MVKPLVGQPAPVVDIFNNDKLMNSPQIVYLGLGVSFYKWQRIYTARAVVKNVL